MPPADPADPADVTDAAAPVAADPAVLLVGMSAREAGDRPALLRLAREVGAEVAFLQLGDPSVAAALTRLADAGARRVEVVGVSSSPLAPAASWLRRVAGHWWRERGEPRPEVATAPRLLGAPGAPDAADLDAVRRTVRPLTGREAGLTSAAWEAPTQHRRQLLLCRGPRCTARGADATAEALVLALVGAGLGDDDVLLTPTGCLTPCNRAPVAVVHPGDTWYAGVSPAVARRLVDEHLVEGRALADHRLPRDPAPPATDALG